MRLVGLGSSLRAFSSFYVERCAVPRVVYSRWCVRLVGLGSSLRAFSSCYVELCAVHRFVLGTTVHVTLYPACEDF